MAPEKQRRAGSRPEHNGRLLFATCDPAELIPLIALSQITWRNTHEFARPGGLRAIPDDSAYSNLGPLPTRTAASRNAIELAHHRLKVLRHGHSARQTAQ